MSEQYQEHRVFTLLEVLNSIQKTLSNRYQSAYWIKAEMNKLNHYAYSGHCYPDLVEKSDRKVVAQMRAVIWSGTFQTVNKKFKDTLKEPLKDGINILFLAKIIFTPEHGLTLQILDIDPAYSLGQLALEKQKNIARLKEEGIFFKNKALKMPLLPQRIAIISVETSKGYADFLKIINKNKKGYRLIQQLFPSRLQGENAVNDMVRQLNKIKKLADYFDVVAIIRGGGGEVGLASFNDYKLAKTIAGFPIPVLTGIGHATNETISEMVAYRNAITPTECAQFLLNHFEQFDAALQEMQQHLINFTQQRLAQQKEIQNNFGISIERTSRFAFQKQRIMLGNLTKNLNRSGWQYLSQQKTLLEQTGHNISLVNPELVLKRGFSITKIKGKSIGPNSNLPDIDTEIETILWNGKLKSRITEKKIKNNKHGNK